MTKAKLDTVETLLRMLRISSRENGSNSSTSKSIRRYLRLLGHKGGSCRIPRKSA